MKKFTLSEDRKYIVEEAPPEPERSRGDAAIWDADEFKKAHTEWREKIKTLRRYPAEGFEGYPLDTVFIEGGNFEVIKQMKEDNVWWPALHFPVKDGVETRSVAIPLSKEPTGKEEMSAENYVMGVKELHPKKECFSHSDLKTAFIAGAKSESSQGREWIDVERELPKVNQNVIVCIVDVFGESFIDIANYTKEQEWYRPFKNVEGITHWMPLPPPPSQSSLGSKGEKPPE